MKMPTLAIAMACFCSAASAENPTIDPELANRIEIMQTGRYSQTKNIPPVDQLNPLKVVIKTRIPQSVVSVRQAVEFLLARSGYQLADQSILSEESLSLLSLPLPSVQREIGPMTLDQALRTLAGEAFELVVDPVHRKIGFELSARIIKLTRID